MNVSRNIGSASLSQSTGVLAYVVISRCMTGGVDLCATFMAIPERKYERMRLGDVYKAFYS